MNIATIDPSLSTTSTRQLKPWARRVTRTSRTTGRVVAIAAVLSLPLVGATAAAAEPASPSTSITTTSTMSKAAIEQREAEQVRVGGQAGGHAAQQQSYLDRLERDADGEAAASAGRTGFAAQQRAYVAHLAQVARGSAIDPGAAQFAASAASEDTGDGVPVPLAVLFGIGGMAFGTGVAVASRRLRLPQERLAV